MAKSEECVDWQQNCAGLNQRGMYLLDSGLWSDCSFRVCNHILKGHKLFLAMASPVFGNMFFGSLPEGTDPILIEDIDLETFEDLLEYIYTDKVTIETFDEAVELYYAADRYMLPELSKRCSAEIASRLAPANACQAYESATQCRDTLLMDKCLQFISSNTREVLEDSSFMKIDLTTMEKVFSLERMNIDSELELLNAMTRYVKAHKERTDEESNKDSEQESSASSISENTILDTEGELLLGDVLKQIRFLTLSSSQFADFHTESSLLSESDCLGILMNIASSSSKVAMPEGFSKYRNKRLNTRTQQQNDTEPEASGKLETAYCARKSTKSNGYYENYLSKLNSTVMFSADRDLDLIGVQVPTQMKGNKMADIYVERVTVTLKSWTIGNKLIVTGNLCAPVNYNGFTDVMFESACRLTKDQAYVIYLTFSVNGQYPCSLYTGKATVGVDDRMATVNLIDNSEQMNSNFVKSFIIRY